MGTPKISSDPSPRPSRRASSLASGAVSGLASCLALQPFEVIKTRLQEPNGSLNLPRLVQSSGIRVLWRGTVPALWRNVPGGALYFASISQARYLALVISLRWPGVLGPLFDVERRVPTSAGNLVIGGLARSFAGFVLMPATLVKTRFESALYSQTPGYSSLLGALRTIVDSDGLKGLWRGWAPTIARDAPYAGLYLAFYEKLKKTLTLDNPTMSLGISALLASGMATVLTHPFDVIRARVQLDPTQTSTGLRVLLQEAGPAGLMRGILPRMTRKALASAIAWVVYESLPS